MVLFATYTVWRYITCARDVVHVREPTYIFGILEARGALYVQRSLRPGRQLGLLQPGVRDRGGRRAPLWWTGRGLPRLRGEDARRALPTDGERPPRGVPRRGRDEAAAQDPRPAHHQGPRNNHRLVYRRPGTT